MNAKAKCKASSQMTVTPHSPRCPDTGDPHLRHNQDFCPNYSNQLFANTSDRLSIGLLSHRSHKSVSPVELRSGLYNDRSDPNSSLILRQKLLHRNKAGPLVGSSHTPKSGRKSYNRSQNNGFKFHNFVVNEDKRSCLEEQDGTKKITVSHWKRPNAPPLVSDDSRESSSEPISSPPSQSILETLLAPTPSVPTISQTTEDHQRISKRKPLHVRRVLRQHKQVMSVLSAQSQDEPLDLSFKRINFNVNSLTSDSNDMDIGLMVDNAANDRLICDSPTESVQHLIKSVNRSAAQASAIMSSVKCATNGDHLSSSSSFDPTVGQKPVPLNSSVSSKQQKLRQTQRSLIKKQLEETFKQNGFLVKTKQVSDANNSAMFCKFRQLRKYTRYYLKSWHHHLPDEVNKLWKGFLPPKTEKPNSSHN